MAMSLKRAIAKRDKYVARRKAEYKASTGRRTATLRRGSSAAGQQERAEVQARQEQVIKAQKEKVRQETIQKEIKVKEQAQQKQQAQQLQATKIQTQEMALRLSEQQQTSSQYHDPKVLTVSKLKEIAKEKKEIKELETRGPLKQSEVQPVIRRTFKEKSSANHLAIHNP